MSIQLKPVICCSCQGCKTSTARQARHAGVDLDHSRALRRSQADPRRLRQMLLNLVLNAIQALHGSEDDGVVRIRTACRWFQRQRQRPRCAQRTPRSDLFEAFASSRNDGTGLGLHLAHLIAAQAHGETPQTLSCFTFLIATWQLIDLVYRPQLLQSLTGMTPDGTSACDEKYEDAISRSIPFRS